MWLMSNYRRYDKRIYYKLIEVASLITGQSTEDAYNAFLPINLISILTALGANTETLANTPELTTLWNNYIWNQYEEYAITFIDLPLEEDDSKAYDPAYYRRPFNKWWGAFYQRLVYSLDRYVPLIRLYEAQKSDLLSKITSTTTTNNNSNYSDEDTTTLQGTTTGNDSTSANSKTNNNMNDVPTNYGNYNNIDYNTNISDTNVESKTNSDNSVNVNNTTTTNKSGNNEGQSTTEVDNTNLTPIEDRLNSIRTKWENLYEAWANEFKDMFILIN